jgi:hypothetical protein
MIPVAQLSMIRVVPPLELALSVGDASPAAVSLLLSRPCLLLRLPPRAYLPLMRMECRRVCQLR